MAASSASAKPAPWEVWLAYLRFADHPEAGKVRPVVIIDGKAAAIVVAKVTTALRNGFDAAKTRAKELQSEARGGWQATTGETYDSTSADERDSLTRPMSPLLTALSPP